MKDEYEKLLDIKKKEDDNHTAKLKQMNEKYKLDLETLRIENSKNSEDLNEQI